MHHSVLFGLNQKIGHVLYQVFRDVYEKEIGRPMIETVAAADCFVAIVVCSDKNVLHIGIVHVKQMKPVPPFPSFEKFVRKHVF
jgi:hypothetical protein